VEGGIEITALHNHLLRNVPFTMLHALRRSRRSPAKLAGVLRTALEESSTPLAAPAPAGSPPPIDLDTGAIEKTLGAKGTANAGWYSFHSPAGGNNDHRTIGMTIPISMGSGIVINFQPTGGGKAAITGDFVLIANEVNPVLKTLAGNWKSKVTALHSHMLDEQPHLYYALLGERQCTEARNRLEGRLGQGQPQEMTRPEDATSSEPASPATTGTCAARPGGGGDRHASGRFPLQS